MALSFRPRVLALGQPSQKPLPLPKKLPAPTAPIPPAASSSSLWQRHEHGSYRHYYFRRKPGSGAAGTTDARLALLEVGVR
jgi:hypothetical protein